MLANDIGIDLGTANILVWVRGKGIVVREPSVVARDEEKKKILAVGEQARQMIGRTPGSIRLIRPLSEGVIADYETTEMIMKHFMVEAGVKRWLFRPRVMVCVPTNVTGVEGRAVLEAGYQSGAKEVYLISEPMAAAIGCGLDVLAPTANMVVDIGGGTTDIAVISLGGEVNGESLRIGGAHLEEAITRYIKRVHSLAVGERTAEEIKIELGAAVPGVDKRRPIRGRDLVTGLPATIELTSDEIYKAIEEPVKSLIESIKRVLEKTPPELSSDIVSNGIVLTGGGALLTGLVDLVAEETQVPVRIAEEPLTCVVRGTGEAFQFKDQLGGIVTRGLRPAR